MQHRQEAGAAVYITIPAAPLDTTDSIGFSHRVGSGSLSTTTSQGPAAARAASAVQAARLRTKETEGSPIPTSPLIAGSCTSRAQLQPNIWRFVSLSDAALGRRSKRRRCFRLGAGGAELLSCQKDSLTWNWQL